MAIDLWDLANILEKIFDFEPWKTQAVHPIGIRLIRRWFKNTLILHTQKVGQSGVDNFFKLQFFFYNEESIYIFYTTLNFNHAKSFRICVFRLRPSYSCAYFFCVWVRDGKNPLF